MFDHVKTLLLNEPAGIVTPHTALSLEPIDTAYVKRALGGTLKIAYDAVFGGDCDIAAKCLRLQTLLPILHTPELVGFTTGRDARISYTPGAVSFTTLGLDQPTTEADVMIRKPGAGNALYRCYYDVTLTRTASDTVTVTGPGVTQTVTVAYTNGYTDFIEVPSGFACAIPDIAIGESRHLTVFRPLRDSFSDIFTRIGKVGAASVLFSGYTEASQLLNIFNSSPDKILQLGAFCLALAFSIEAA